MSSSVFVAKSGQSKCRRMKCNRNVMHKRAKGNYLCWINKLHFKCYEIHAEQPNTTAKSAHSSPPPPPTHTHTQTHCVAANAPDWFYNCTEAIARAIDARIVMIAATTIKSAKGNTYTNNYLFVYMRMNATTNAIKVNATQRKRNKFPQLNFEFTNVSDGGKLCKPRASRRSRATTGSS